MTEMDEAADAEGDRATATADAEGDRGSTTTPAGQRAERLVYDRLRAALPKDTVVLPNVRWLVRDHGRVRPGEADIVVGDPDRGILVIEVKAGEIRRDASGTWWSGHAPLSRTPFEQAADSRFTLVRKLSELQEWPVGLKPIAGHAVAFPDVELDSMRGRLGLLGFEFDSGLVADQSTFVATSAGQAELRLFLDHAFEAWSGGAETRVPGRTAIELLTSTMTDPVELRPMLRNEILGGEQEAVRLTNGQIGTLGTLRSQRRAAIVGGAGTGKTMLAAEKARRLAKEGFRTLLVCFNSPLARMLAAETADVAASTGLLEVKTFHQLCEDLAREAGTLPAKPDPVPPEWFSETLPDALDAAIEQDSRRYHAIVVDEGQDFDGGWLASLDELLETPREDVLYVFHDPAQAIYRTDSVSELALAEYVLDLNCRNTQPIHDVVRRFAGPGLTSEALRLEGRPPELILAEREADAIEALRKLLHRLRVDEGVKPWDIAVLTGVSLEDSAVWRHRQFGNEVLWNGQVDAAGHTLGIASSLVPAPPDDASLCDSIRRFKGLERPVVILVELRSDDPRLDQLLYIGASRARQHLAVVGSGAVLGRLGRTGSAGVLESQDEPERNIDPIDGIGAQATRLGSEQERGERHGLIALGPSVPGKAGLATTDLDEERRPEVGGLGRTGQRNDHHRGGPTHQVRLDDQARVRAADDVTAHIRKVHDVDVAARWTDGRGIAPDPYHSISDQSLAAIGRYAIAQSRFSSFWASIAASSWTWSESWSVRRNAAPMVALTVWPFWPAASRTRVTSSVGRLIESFVWGDRESSDPYGVRISANALVEYDCRSLMVRRMVG